MTEQQHLTVAQRLDDRGNIVRVRLEAADGSVLPAFTAGAHLNLYIPELDIWRSYSLCSDPQETAYYEIGVLKDPDSRGGSVAVHRLAQPGSSFVVEGPRNHFPLAEDAQRSVLIGGGIGITPMIAMAWRLQRLGRDFLLHYCTRSEGVTAFHDDLKQAPFGEWVMFHFDNRDDDQRFHPARDLPAPADGTHLYVCGPKGFMDWVIGEAEAAGHAVDHIHREYFSTDVDTSGDTFDVEARKSGKTLTVGPDDTIAKVLAKAGIKVDVKCEEGVCGTCVTDVLEGEIDHRDQFLTEEERADGDQMCVCCSRARGSKLVLDI